MDNLDEVAAALTRDLDALDKAREGAFSRSREVVRHAGSAMKAMHRGDDAREHLRAAKAAWRELRRAVRGHAALEAAGFTEAAGQELTEAFLLDAYVRDRPVPTPSALSVDAASYVLGLGDLVGELRRLSLHALVHGDADAATRRLAQMEVVYETLTRFDYPAAVVEVRRKQDAARGMVERTRGEVAVGVRMRRLEERLAGTSAK